jgi:hypothetical protein
VASSETSQVSSPHHFAFLAPANFTQGGVNRKPVEPRRKLSSAAKTVGLAKSRPENILNDFLGVCNFAQDSLGHIIKFRRITIENRLEGLLISGLEPLDEIGIVMLRFSLSVHTH